HAAPTDHLLDLVIAEPAQAQEVLVVGLGRWGLSGAASLVQPVQQLPQRRFGRQAGGGAEAAADLKQDGVRLDGPGEATLANGAGLQVPLVALLLLYRQAVAQQAAPRLPSRALQLSAHVAISARPRPRSSRSTSYSTRRRVKSDAPCAAL